MENNLDSQGVDIIAQPKVVSLKSYRFARDPGEYESAGHQHTQETFEAKMERIYPFSKYGNAMLGPWNSAMADQIMEEEKKEKKQQILSPLAEQKKGHGYFVPAVDKTLE